MRIAIVDDLAAERALLKDRLEQQLHRRSVQTDILEYERASIYGSGKESALYCRISGYLYGWHNGHGGGKEAARKPTRTACWFLPRPRPTMRWRAFRYGRCTIWSSPLPKRTSTR